MASESDPVLGKTFQRIVLSLTVLLVIAGFSISRAQADDWHHGHGYGHGHGNHAHAAAYSTVPHWIPPESRAFYHPYYAGHVYYGPHHHYHSVYQFPVYANGAVVYQPYNYCGNHIFVGAALPLP